MKKRNCRKTLEEIQQHRAAVELRKMTDAQLCGFFDSWETKIRTAAIREFLFGLPDYKGIGQATRGKLWDYARANGFLPENEKGI
jgi:hypothetical protein